MGRSAGATRLILTVVRVSLLSGRVRVGLGRAAHTSDGAQVPPARRCGQNGARMGVVWGPIRQLYPTGGPYRLAGSGGECFTKSSSKPFRNGAQEINTKKGRTVN